MISVFVIDKIVLSNHDDDTYAYIECINKNTNEIMFHLPSSFLTHFFISDNEYYIAGITYVDLDNPYQLIILNIYFFKYLHLFGDGDVVYELFSYETQDYLLKYQVKNRLSNNIWAREPSVFWYNLRNPDLQFVYENNILSGISLLDPNNERITIFINE